MPKVPVVVFVDIDSARAAPPRGDALPGLLERLAAERVVLVLSTHRTRAEIESDRQALGLFHPFICENGAAAFVPDRYFGSEVQSTRKVSGYRVLEFGSPYEQVLDRLGRVADRLNLGVLGFHDMSVEQVARECGLSLLEARLAKLREYDEPFRLLCINPVAERRLLKALDSASMTCVRRGGFYHAGTVRGARAAVTALSALYRVAFSDVTTAIAGLTAAPEDLARGVDLVLDSPGLAAARSAAAADWIERILQEVHYVRGGGASAPAARCAR